MTFFKPVRFDTSKVFVYDIETDGLHGEYTKVHCIVIVDYHTEEVFEYRPHEIEEAIKKLSEADIICGHNIEGFDNIVLEDLYEELWKSVKAKSVFIDTLAMSRILSNNRLVRDVALVESGKIDALEMKKHYGGHGLEAWGVRLSSFFTDNDYHKGEFAKTTDWKGFSEEMLKYCKQDVILNRKLLELLISTMNKYNCPWFPIQLESELLGLLARQQIYGCSFDMDKAEKLLNILLSERERLLLEINKTMKGYTEVMKTPEYFKAVYAGKEYRSTTKGNLSNDLWKLFKDTINPDTDSKVTRKHLDSLIEAGPLREKYHEFNPNSAKDIERNFRAIYNWEPEEYTSQAIAKCGTEVLNSLDYPEAKLLTELEVVNDRLEKLWMSSNKPGYMNMLGEDGKLHGYVNHIGTITNRCAHKDPNLGQVPAHTVPYGKEFRELFIASKGRKLVGSDLSGIEMRGEAEYRLEYGDEDYMDAVVHGNQDEGTDAHSRNAKTLGVSRSDAKTWKYADLYGGGLLKLGSIPEVSEEYIKQAVDKYFKDGKCTAPSNILASIENLKPPKPVTPTNVGAVLRGRELKKKMAAANEALASVISNCKEQHDLQGFVKALDGRPIFTRSGHSACNSLLQSWGAIVAKTWYIIIYRKLLTEGLKADIVLFVHDEVAIDTAEEDVERVKEICKEAIQEAREVLGIYCPLDVDVKVGNSWSEIH